MVMCCSSTHGQLCFWWILLIEDVTVVLLLLPYTTYLHGERSLARS